MVGSANLSGDVDSFAAKMNASGLGDGTPLVVIFLESHR
jgi:hypothetical protein